MKNEPKSADAEAAASAGLLGGASIKRKLVLIIMLVSSSAIILSSSAFVAYEWFSFRQRMVDDLSALAEMIGDNSTGALSFDYPEDAVEVLHALRARTPIEFACVYSENGDVFATYQRDESSTVEPPPTVERDGHQFHHSRLDTWRQIYLDGRPLGNVYLRSDFSELSALLKQSITVSALLVLLSCAVAYSLAERLQRKVSAPIFSLADTAKSISDSRDYSVRAVKHSEDEIGLLTDAFNQMLDQVQDSDVALRESEEKLRRVIDNLVGSFVYTHDLEGKFIYVSQSMTDVLGYSTEDFLTHFTEYLTDHPVNREVIEHTELGMRGIQQPPYEVQLFHKNGNKHWLEVAEVPVRDISGAVMAVEGIAHDITERKRAEEAMRTSEERFRAVIENAADAIFMHDLNGRILDANQQACDSLGYTREELLSLNVSDIETEQYLAGELAEIWRNLSSGERITLEGEHSRKDGSTFPVEIRLGLLDIGGEKLVLGLVRDVTDRKRLEAQLRQSQKTEAIGQLTGGIAHDFNNILQAILGYGQMALEDVDPASEAHEELEQVMKAAERATTLVRQLLAFSRRQVLELRDLDLSEVINDLAKMMRRVIGEHIALEIHSQPGLMSVRADRGQVEQVLMNLCVNARDAMTDGGTLSIETGNTEFDEEYCQTNTWAIPGSYVLISVTDMGCGMDEETQQHMFEPFFTTKETGKGTGLGLSTVYGIVRQHNGMINVYSEMGKGTTFRIYLPKVTSSTIEKEEEETAPLPGGTETILLAEDDEMVRSLVKRVLEEAGYTVLAANDGEEAVRIFDANAEDIDLAVLDVVMPKAGGRAVFDHINARRPETRVLFASGYSSSSIHTNFVLHEGMKLIQKPYHREALLRRVREVLDE